MEKSSVQEAIGLKLKSSQFWLAAHRGMELLCTARKRCAKLWESSCASWESEIQSKSCQVLGVEVRKQKDFLNSDVFQRPHVRTVQPNLGFGLAPQSDYGMSCRACRDGIYPIMFFRLAMIHPNQRDDLHQFWSHLKKQKQSRRGISRTPATKRWRATFDTTWC